MPPRTSIRQDITNGLRRIRLHSPYFPTPDYYEGDGIEDINILSDVNEIDMIRNHQSRHLDYDYQDDIKTWIR